MRAKSMVQVKDQMRRIERKMLDHYCYPVNKKRYTRFCKIADEVSDNMLKYFGVKHLWDNEAYYRMNEPLPYDVRITH